MKIFLILLLLSIEALILMNNKFFFQDKKQSQWMETETHCIGRYLIVLPKGTQVKASYITGGSTVATFSGVTAVEFKQRLTARQQELQQTRHSKGGSLFVERDDITANHITLVSWASKVGRRVYQYEEYQYLPQDAALYVFVSKGNANEESKKRSAASQRVLGSRLRYRSPLEIPKDDGFCICEGLITGSGINKEEMAVGFFLPVQPYISLSVTSFVTRYDMPINTKESSAVSGLPGSKILRNTSRKWGDLKTHEILLKYKDDGAQFYEFDLKVPAKGSSLEYPYMAISLHAGTYEKTEDGKPINIFQHDEQAIQLWDAIVGSIRLRPGAVQK